MNFTKELLHQILDPKIPANERARLRCQYAKRLEEAGDYDRAREAMGELWQGVGDRPTLEGLDEETKGEVLLRDGALTGWIGSVEQIKGAQEAAKNLISESIAILEALHDIKKLAEAQIELAVCYWREGDCDNARVLLAEALRYTDDKDGDLRATALLRSAAVEKVANRLNDALSILKTAAPLFEKSSNHTIQGRFYNELATVLKNLGTSENRADYIERALSEYDTARSHFEQAGHDRYQACVENNLAMLFFKANRLAEAHEHLDRAETLFTTLSDAVHQAQVAETRARVLLAEGNNIQAEKNARRAVQLLKNGDESSLQAEALTTHGTALSQLQHKDEARAAFELAIQVAEQADDLESAGLAALTFVEQLSECLSDDELFTVLERADERLEKTQNPDFLRRLKNCFRLCGSRILWPPWPNSFEKSVHRHEARLILRALEETGGAIAKAARKLELSRQGLQRILNSRHEDLRTRIAEIKDRQRELSHSENSGGALSEENSSEINCVKILFVEDNQMVAGAVRETLESKGWVVETCSDGTAALETIASDAHYDLLLLDCELPGVNGLELVQRARKLTHRSRTPIIMFSANPVEAAALKAGADEFLPKPQGISALVETITRLIDEHEKEHDDYLN